MLVHHNVPTIYHSGDQRSKRRKQEDEEAESLPVADRLANQVGADFQ